MGCISQVMSRALASLGLVLVICACSGRDARMRDPEPPSPLEVMHAANDDLELGVDVEPDRWDVIFEGDEIAVDWYWNHPTRSVCRRGWKAWVRRVKAPASADGRHLFGGSYIQAYGSDSSIISVEVVWQARP